MAVFASGTDLALVRLEDDLNGSKVAEVAGRGYALIGSIGVNDGVSKVDCEPGALAVAMMPYAGTVFAGMFGEHLKEHQLRNKSV